MAMMLRAGTPSVPSSAMGKVIFPPADASSEGGDESTGVGTADGGATVLSLAVIVGDLDHGISTAPSQKIAPSIRFGIRAARTSPATNARISESVGEGNGVVWSGRRGCTFTHETPCVGFSMAVLKLPSNGPRSRRRNELSPKVRHGVNCSGDAPSSPSPTQLCQQIPGAKNYSKD